MVVADVDEDGARETATLIGADDRVEVAARRRDATTASVARMVAAHGRAGSAGSTARATSPASAPSQKPFIDHTLAEWQRVIDVDLTGVFLCMQAELRQMLAQGDGGAIVNVSSGAGVVPAPGQPHYTAAKHGVLGLTKQAAQEYARNGIRVNAVLPGQTETEPMQAYLDAQPDGGERILRRIPMGRMAHARRDRGVDRVAVLRRVVVRQRRVAARRRRTDRAIVPMTTCNPYSHEFHDDPFPMYRDAARQRALLPQPRPRLLGAVPLRRRARRAARSRRPTARGYGITLEQDNSLPMLLTTDPPDHTELRRLVSRAFTPRRVADLEPEIRDARAGGSSSRSLAQGRGRPRRRLRGAPPDGRDRAHARRAASRTRTQLRDWTNALLDRDEGVARRHARPASRPRSTSSSTSRDFVAERRAAVAAGNAPDDLTTALCDRGHRRRRALRRAGRRLPASC